MPEGSQLNYLRAMVDLMDRGELIRNHTLATVLDVRPPSVTEMLGRMERGGLVARGTRRGEWLLTEKGGRLACQFVRRHRLIETWLIESLGVDWATAHEEAHSLEHAMSGRLEKLLDAHLGHPARDPHGATIPRGDIYQADENVVPMIALTDGERAQVARLSDRDSERIQYWQSVGLELNVPLKRIAAAPFDGPIEWSVDGTRCHLASGAMEGVWVRRMEVAS
jgi:DtxR family transcriptional regulator, Mn-dependent transcriptional regulator